MKSYLPIARVGRLVFAIIALFLQGCASSSGANTFNGLPFNPSEPATDFVLINQYGNSVSLSDFRGDLVLLYFGFTQCPDECPATMGIWKQAHSQLGEQAEHVHFLMVTVDPERDTPEVLGEYLANFNPDFIGLRGTLEQLEDLAFAYNAYFKKLPLEEDEVMSAHTSGDDGHDHVADYLVAHTTLTFVIDQSGQLVLVFPLETPAGDIVSDLQQLLHQ